MQWNSITLENRWMFNSFTFSFLHLVVSLNFNFCRDVFFGFLKPAMHMKHVDGCIRGEKLWPAFNLKGVRESLRWPFSYITFEMKLWFNVWWTILFFHSIILNLNFTWMHNACKCLNHLHYANMRRIKISNRKLSIGFQWTLGFFFSFFFFFLILLNMLSVQQCMLPAEQVRRIYFKRQGHK